MTILYAGDPVEADQWVGAVCDLAPGLSFRRWPDSGPPDEIDFIIVGGRMPGDFSPFRRLRGIQSTWAGVNHLLQSGALPPGVPVARMVDDGLTCSMTEYLVFQVLDHLRHGPVLRAAQDDGRWLSSTAIEPSRSTIGIMGLGALGQDAAQQLVSLGLTVRGWSRTVKSVPHVTSFTGQEQVAAFLSGSDILICLLPLTDD